LQVSADASKYDGSSPNEQLVGLLLKHHRRIYGFILTLVPNLSDADDIMQETAFVMCRRFGEFEPGTNFIAWAIAISRNQVISFRKKQHSHSKMKFAEDVLEELTSLAAEKIGTIDKRVYALEECLNKLQENDRKLIGKRYEKGIKLRQIAQEIGRPEQGLYKSMARIHNVLRLCVERTLSIWKTV
jgi:RNA polymerase sigma-70 factor (ECF subfamily)